MNIDHQPRALGRSSPGRAVAAFLAGMLLIPHANAADRMAVPDNRTLEAQATGRWIELDAHRDKRVYVALTGSRGYDGLPRIHLRVDRLPDAEDLAATEITTEDIDCWRGETRLVSIRRHDKNGVPLGSYHYETPQPPERILSFYQSPLAEFCRGEHLLTTLAGGKERWLEVAHKQKALLREEWRRRIPDRLIALPD